MYFGLEKTRIPRRFASVGIVQSLGISPVNGPCVGLLIEVRELLYFFYSLGLMIAGCL